MKLWALLIVATAAFHDLSWQWLPYELQGDWRALTGWFPLAALGWVCARASMDRSVAFACMAAVMMGSTTTLCSVAWFLWRWDAGWNCSKTFSGWMVLLSALLACLALIDWKQDESAPRTTPE